MVTYRSHDYFFTNKEVKRLKWWSINDIWQLSEVWKHWHSWNLALGRGELPMYLYKIMCCMSDVTCNKYTMLASGMSHVSIWGNVYISIQHPQGNQGIARRNSQPTKIKVSTRHVSRTKRRSKYRTTSIFVLDMFLDRESHVNQQKAQISRWWNKITKLG